MSIRSEAAGAVPAPPTASVAALDLSANATATACMPDNHVAATVDAARAADSALGEANAISTNHPDHPLKRTFVATIRANLGELCLRKTKGTWAPSTDALRAMMQQKKFVDLSGAAESVGDLKSVVLHSLTLSSVSSDFEVPVGVKITGVDNSTYSLTGEAYSTVVAPNVATHAPRLLQQDDVALAYEFSRKFPGYTAENLTEKGIHEVQARRFCLIAADHPIVSAIQENHEKLQMGDISMMPEGLVKIGTDLYKTILPMVKQQVESQIKVRDFSNARLSIEPADAASWSDVRTAMITEAKSALRAELEMELGAAADEGAVQKLRDEFSRRERAIEHNVDSRPCCFSATVDMEYNFLAK